MTTLICKDVDGSTGLDITPNTEDGFISFGNNGSRTGDITIGNASATGNITLEAGTGSVLITGANYLEGNWTPEFKASLTITYINPGTTTYGYWIQFGNVLHFWCNIVWTGLSGGPVTDIIIETPFAPGANTKFSPIHGYTNTSLPVAVNQHLTFGMNNVSTGIRILITNTFSSIFAPDYDVLNAAGFFTVSGTVYDPVFP